MARVILVSFAVTAAAVGCKGDIELEIASDRPVPRAIDSICVGVADENTGGGEFGSAYRLTGAIASLPQTLRIDPGGADHAWAWVRGDRGGAPAATAAAAIDFSGDVTLAMPSCQLGLSAAPTARGAAVGPGRALIAASQGQGGELIVAVAAGSAAVLRAQGNALAVAAAPAPAPPAGTPVSVIAADVDGDCDDDVIVATDSAPPELWRRDGASFVDAGPIGTTAAAAVAAADADRDGDFDLILGAGGTLELWRNSGSGAFTLDPAALAGGGRVTEISALAVGDIDGDGAPDLVVGQNNAALAAWLGNATGGFDADEQNAVVPPVVLDVASMTLADADGDYDPDLAVAVRGAPMRLYIDRDGSLEDQSFVRLPQPAATAEQIAFGGWDAQCGPDAVVAADVGAPTLSGSAGGVFVGSDAAPPATGVVMVDLDGDGNLDAVLATVNGVIWLAR